MIQIPKKEQERLLRMIVSVTDVFEKRGKTTEEINELFSMLVTTYYVTRTNDSDPRRLNHFIEKVQNIIEKHRKNK